MLAIMPNNCELFKQIAEGDKTAFKFIFELYKERFFFAAHKLTRSAYLSEEIVQEVFITLWLKRSLLGAACKPENYLFSILYNCIYHQFKKIGEYKNMMRIIEENGIENNEPAIEDKLQEKQKKKILDIIISQLPQQQQLVYKLSKQEGLSRLEIAGLMSIAPNSVKNHLLTAVKSIRVHFKDKKLACV